MIPYMLETTLMSTVTTPTNPISFSNLLYSHKKSSEHNKYSNEDSNCPDDLFQRKCVEQHMLATQPMLGNSCILRKHGLVDKQYMY